MNIELSDQELEAVVSALSRNYARIRDFHYDYEKKYVAGQPGYVKQENDAILKELADIKALHYKLSSVLSAGRAV